MSGLRKYIWIGLIAARSNLAYLSEVTTRVIFLGVILYIFLQLWRVTFTQANTERLGGLTLPQMLWYLAMTESIILSAPRIAAEVDQDVRTGAIALQLTKPLMYPLYRLWTTLGERAVRFLLNVSVGVLLVLIFVGPIELHPTGLAMLALALPMAFVLDFLGNFLVGLAAFWLEDTTGLTLIYSRLTMILGGMLIPIELFPPALQPIVNALPFANIVYGPARLFVRPEQAFLGELFVRQGSAILVFAIAVTLVYSAAKRRIHANGG